jgi:hypothetical protein
VTEGGAKKSERFERMRAAFDAARTARPDLLCESQFIFGGRVARMRIVGPALAEHITRPFAHLRTSSDARAALTIDLWDERETHVPYPMQSGSRAMDVPDTIFPSGHGVLAASPSGRFVRYECPAWVTWFDRGARHMIGWRFCADRLSIHERTRPLPFLLAVWYADQGVHVIHAGLVARGQRGVLLCGSNGAGKSTSSLMCMAAGFDFLSDDHVGIDSPGDTAFLGHSMFGTTRIEPSHLTRFPWLAPHGLPSPEPLEGKSLVLLDEVMPERMRVSVPVVAIGLPRIVDRPHSSIRRASGGETLRAIAPSSLMLMPFGATRGRFDALGRLAEHVPAYWLELGRDLGDIAPRVDELLALVK